MPPSSEDSIWVECGACKGWDLFENYKTGEPYKASKIAKMKLMCRCCKLEQTLRNLENETALMRNKVSALEKGKATEAKTWADLAKVVKDDQQAAKVELQNYVDKKTTAATKDPNPLTAPQLHQTASEVFEINRRKLNVIISGLPEAGNDIDSFIRFANKDHRLQQELRTSDLVHAERLGRGGTTLRPRLLCIKMGNPESRKVVLEMWKTPSTSNQHAAIYVRPDLTKAQLEVDKQLRDALKVAGKDKFIIHKGKIVPRLAPGETRYRTAELVGEATNVNALNSITIDHNVPDKIAKSQQAASSQTARVPPTSVTKTGTPSSNLLPSRAKQSKELSTGSLLTKATLSCLSSSQRDLPVKSSDRTELASTTQTSTNSSMVVPPMMNSVSSLQECSNDILLPLNGSIIQCDGFGLSSSLLHVEDRSFQSLSQDTQDIDPLEGLVTIEKDTCKRQNQVIISDGTLDTFISTTRPGLEPPSAQLLENSLDRSVKLTADTIIAKAVAAETISVELEPRDINPETTAASDSNQNVEMPPNLILNASNSSLLTGLVSIEKSSSSKSILLPEADGDEETDLIPPYETATTRRAAARKEKREIKIKAAIGDNIDTRINKLKKKSKQEA
jgi:hypothetical protein